MIRYIGRLLRSKVFNNLWNQFLLDGFSHLIPLILIPYLFNTIGVDYYGRINFALAFSFYFQIVNEWGFDLSNVPHVANNKHNKVKLSELLSSVLCAKIFIISITSIIYIALIFILPNMQNLYALYLLALIRMFGIILSPIWFFRSMEDSKFVTKVVLPVKILTTLPIFFLVKSADNYLWVMFFFAMETLLSAIVALTVLLKKYDLKLIRPSWLSVKYYLIDSIPYFMSTFFTRIYSNSNTVILGFVFNEAVVGIYSAAEKLYNAYCSFVLPIIEKVLFPYFIRIKNFARINKMLGVMIAANILMVLVVYIGAPYAIPYFIKGNFEDLVYYFNYFLILMCFSIPNSLFGYTYLGVLGRVQEIKKSSIIASSFYVIVVAVLFFIRQVSIVSLIFTLLAANILSLTIRLNYIRIYRKGALR